MGLSIRELKAHLSAHGVDFSTCREKTELEELWSNVQSAKQAAEGTEDAAKETSASADGRDSFCNQADQDAAKKISALVDGGFAMRKVDGRRCWVEFVDGDDALCHWSDGSDAIIDVQDLEPSDIGSFGPEPFKGSFEEARAEAFRLGCLLVTSVGSGNESKKERLQVLALAAEEAAVLIQENAIFWQGNIKSLRIPHQQQLAPHGAPVISMVLPLATDAMRVLSTSEDISVESLVQDFVAALDKQEEHRQAATTRLLSSEAFLRQEQDEEYAAALEADRAKEADAAAGLESAAPQPDVQEEAVAACVQSAQDRDAISEAAAVEQEKERIEADQQLAKRRRLLAEEFQLEADAEQPASGRVRLMLRLPKGERVERGFTAEDTLSKVQRWAECCALLPEAKGQDLVIPAKFELYTSFPRRKLGGDEDDQKSLKELGLAPSAALLLISSDA